MNEDQKDLVHIWTDYGVKRIDSTLRALQILEMEDGYFPKAVTLLCRVRYLTDGVILGALGFVRGFTGAWKVERRRKHPLEFDVMLCDDLGGRTVIQSLQRQVFGLFVIRRKNYICGRGRRPHVLRCGKASLLHCFTLCLCLILI